MRPKTKKYEAGAKLMAQEAPRLMKGEPEPDSGPPLPVLGKVIEEPVLHHCPDCHAILLLLSRHSLPEDVRVQFVKHLV